MLVAAVKGMCSEELSSSKIHHFLTWLTQLDCIIAHRISVDVKALVTCDKSDYRRVPVRAWVCR